MRTPLIPLLTAALLAWPVAAPAQDLFSPVITVDDSAITGWEIDQRTRLLEFFNTPGDVARLAREQLVEDRLKEAIFARAQIALSEEGLARAVEDFAGRANLDADRFLTLLGQNGIDAQTLRDYVRVNVTWRDFIRARFSDRVTVTEADIDAAIGRPAQASGIEVLLSEIIIPAPPPEAARAQARALEISRITSVEAFSAAAREVSAVPSREVGGRLDWRPIDMFPTGLQTLLLSLAPGEVTQPLALPGAIALLQVRDVRETGYTPAPIALVDYAVFTIPGGRSPEALAEAARIAVAADTCDDLYGIAQGLPEDRLTRVEVAPSELPEGIGLELAGLDPDESSYRLTDETGTVLLFVMLCGRTPATEAEVDRDAVRASLLSERLAGFADALLADARADALILGE